nr:DNA-directed DNA polymerase [Tanacetum cinerariifolium]
MHTHASNSELVIPLLEPEQTLNRRLRRRNRRVPFERRNKRPGRLIYLPFLDINRFRHFLDILRNYDPMDDELMWAPDRVVAPTPGSAITIPETANEFAIKVLFDRLLGEIRAFSQHENKTINDAWLRMKEMFRNCHGHNVSKGNIIKIFYHGLNETTQEALNVAAGGIFLYKTPNQAYQLLEDKVLLKLDWAKKQKSKPSLKRTVSFVDEGSSNSDTDKSMARIDAMTMKIDAQYKELQSRPKQPTSDHNDDDTPLLVKKKQNSCNFLNDADINSESESNTEEPPFEKITLNTNYKIKPSLEEPPLDLELKPLPDNLEYVLLEELSFLPVIISSQLSEQNKSKLVFVLKRHKQAFACKTTDIFEICPPFCKHKIQLLDDKKPVIQKQRRLNPNMQEVVKKEIVKLLNNRIIYPIANSPWVSLIHCVPKKCGITVVTNEKDELVTTRTITVEPVKVFMDDFSVFENSFDNCLNNLDKMLQRCKDAHLVLNWEKCHFMVKRRNYAWTQSVRSRP